MKDAIDRILLGWSDHDIPKNFDTRRDTRDENELLSEIVTTKRYKNIHPDGWRFFSLRELACLQGFLLEHRFFRTGINQNIMTQTGNAFPTTVSAVFYAEIQQQLLHRDGLKPQGHRREEERENAKIRPITAPQGMDEQEGSAAGTGMRV